MPEITKAVSWLARKVRCRRRWGLVGMNAFNHPQRVGGNISSDNKRLMWQRKNPSLQYWIYICIFFISTGSPGSSISPYAWGLPKVRVDRNSPLPLKTGASQDFGPTNGAMNWRGWDISQAKLDRITKNQGQWFLRFISSPWSWPFWLLKLALPLSLIGFGIPNPFELENLNLFFNLSLCTKKTWGNCQLS